VFKSEVYLRIKPYEKEKKDFDEDEYNEWVVPDRVGRRGRNFKIHFRNLFKENVIKTF